MIYVLVDRELRAKSVVENNIGIWRDIIDAR